MTCSVSYSSPLQLPQPSIVSLPAPFLTAPSRLSEPPYISHSPLQFLQSLLHFSQPCYVTAPHHYSHSSHYNFQSPCYDPHSPPIKTLRALRCLTTPHCVSVSHCLTILILSPSRFSHPHPSSDSTPLLFSQPRFSHPPPGFPHLPRFSHPHCPRLLAHAQSRPPPRAGRCALSLRPPRRPRDARPGAQCACAGAPVWRCARRGQGKG